MLWVIAVSGVLQLFWLSTHYPFLVTRGFRERALFVLTFFRIFLFL